LADAVENEYSKDLETDDNIAYIHMVQSEKRTLLLDGCWLSFANPGYHMQRQQHALSFCFN